MQISITITVKPEEEKNLMLIRKLIFRELNKNRVDFESDKVKYVQEKKSIDARHGGLKLHLKYKVFIGEDISEDDEDKLPEWKTVSGNKSAVIVGSGPAGLFAALKLLEKGIKPIIIERGEKTSDRKRTIAAISTKQTVDSNSNYCFGEGGAGTFSDGKLYTRSNKRGNINKILKTFVYFGAKEEITTDAHPHIGTDSLPQIINNMREKIISLGGEFYFETKVTDFIIDEKNGIKTVRGVETLNLATKEKKSFTGDAVILATGHSAGDIYEDIAKISPESLEAKTFAVGVRVEHPRAVIDSIQYHGKEKGSLGAAEYRLTAQEDSRGVYSFCMCPGGFVVPSQTGPDEIVVNGMSNKNRNSQWSNAAIVVETRPEDIPQSFKDRAEKEGCPALAGLYFRNHLEKLAKNNGQEQKAPAQLLVDFINKKDSEVFPKTSYTPGIVPSRLDRWIPDFISERLRKGFLDFDRSMKGFICDQALMIAMETRTSTPVRIVRDNETMECKGLKGLYPCGEGSGYSGGIVSSAMDGEKAAAVIFRG